MVGQGVVSFTLMIHLKSMQARELLNVTPEALVSSILKRREAAAAALPSALEQRTEENDRAHQLARDARAKLNQLEALEHTDEDHIAAVSKARTVYQEHETFRRRTASRLQTAKNALKDSEEALQFWSEMSQGGWGHLLEDAEHLTSGGDSSYAKLKQRKHAGEDEQ